MKIEDNHIDRLFAASQRTLTNPALDPSQIKVDDRSSSELLNFMAELAKQFWYYNEDGHRDGDWNDFFQTDLSSLLSLIAESFQDKDYHKILSFINAVGKIESHEDHKNELSEKLWELFQLAFQPIFKINEWFQTFTRLHVDTTFHAYLKELIWSKLSFGLRDLYAFYYFAIQSNALNNKEKVDNEFKKFQELDVLWNFNPFPNIRRSKVEMFDFFDNRKAFLNGLREAVKSLHNQQKAIAEKAKNTFYNSLQTKNTEPHIALILGFLNAYRLQQDAINDLVPRHLDFYYREVLQFEKNGALGDQAFVTLVLSKNKDIVTIPSSTLMLGGSDANGNPILFETEKSLQVTPSVITDYRTLIVDISDQSKEVLNTCQVKGFGAPTINKETGLYESFKMFGGSKSQNVSPVDSCLGFAIASPELCLDGGKRCVEILFNKNTSTDNQTSKVKEKLLNNLVELQLTGTKGWFSPDYQKIKSINGNLSICFGLKKSSSSVVPYSEKIHGRGYNSEWPIVKIKLKNKSNAKGLNPYKVFSNISFDSYHIRTTTKDLSILSLVTSTGKASANAIVAPFGGNPSIGSQLIIGCYEVFAKHTKLFRLNVNWLNLPSFSDYYSAYNAYLTDQHLDPVFSKNNFKCSLSWLDVNTGTWYVPPREVPLFEGNNKVDFVTKCGQLCGEKKAGSIVPNSTDKSPLTSVTYTYDTSIDPDYSLKSPIAYSDKSRSGFMSLELTGPDKAFGNDLYPKIISEVTLENTIKAAKKARKHKHKGDQSSSGSSISSDKNKDHNKNSSNTYTPAKPKSGNKGWFKKIFDGLKNKIGSGLKKVKKIYGWVSDHILKYLTPSGGWIKLITDVLKKIWPKKKKEDHAFKPLPNKPYVPKIKGVTIDYCSTFQVIPGSDSENKMFRIHPFGIEEMGVSDKQLIPEYSGDGYVFMGFSHLEFETTLSFFLGVEDLNKTTLSSHYRKIKVEVLGSENWEKVQVLEDSTLGLKKAGIIRVFINRKPEINNPIMPPKNYWLRFSAHQDCVENCRLRMIDTNAVRITRVIKSDNEFNTLNTLKAGTISKFQEPIPAIAKIIQPFSSFGGQNPENDSGLNQRIATRIRNKDRGVSIDYIESIILQEMPEVYQVNISSNPKADYSKPNLKISILPQVTSKSQLDPYHPVASINTLNDVRLLIQNKVSSNVRLEVEHTHFDQVHISLDAVFVEEEAVRMYQEQLNSDLKDFLSPWIENNELAFTRPILHVNDLLKFISARTYLSSFENVKIRVGEKPVYGIFHENNEGKKYNKQQLLPSGPLHVLASADKHQINDVGVSNEDVSTYKTEVVTV